MHPFLEVNKLTDEDIIERLGRAYNFMNAQTALGHSATVQSIREVIQSLEDERQNRMQKITDEEYKRKNPDDKKIIELGKLED
jgi:hypothetical protein